MKYTKFTVKKYKGIEEVSLDFTNNRVLTLVGLNESGKTTVMEAMSLFYRMIKGDEPTEDEVIKFRPKGAGFTGSAELTYDLELEPSDIEKIRGYWREVMGKKTQLDIPLNFSYAFKFPFKLDEFDAKKISRTCTFETRVMKAKKKLSQANNADWQKIISYIKTDLVPEILYYDDFIFEIPKKIQFIKKSAPADIKIESTLDETLNLTWQLVMDDILKSTNKNFKSFQDRVVDNWEKDHSLAKQHISAMEGKLNEIITKRWKDLFVESGKKLNFEKIQLSCVPDGHYINISFDVITTTHKSFRIDERSKGCQWFFSFLLFTEFRKNRTKNILFLLDEPASNLHSSAQEKIIDAIEELSKESLVVYATHSHHLIKIEYLGGAYIIINEILDTDSLAGDMNFDDRAKITAKKYFTYVGEGTGDDKMSYFKPILDALDYRPSSVEPIPNICILEGKNDWYTLKYFQEIIFNDATQLNFYPGAGATKLYDIIRLYLAWGKKFIVVLDGDKEGQEAKAAYNEEFGELVKDKIFTINDILSVKKPAEFLIRDVDKEVITFEALAVKSKAKKALNQSIMQLLAKKKQVTLSKETLTDFRALLDFITKSMK